MICESNPEKIEIENCALRYLKLKNMYTWLDDLLSKNNTKPENGIMIFNALIIDRGPKEHYLGCWLNKSRRFYQYEVQVDPSTQELLKIEAWRDITSDTRIEIEDGGEGKSFGFLALEVLDAMKEVK